MSERIPSKETVQKEVEDAMESILSGRVLVAQMAEEISKAMPDKTVEQQRVALENAETEHLWLQKQLTYIKGQAKQVAEEKLQRQQQFDKLETEYTLRTFELERLKLEKQEPGLRDEEWAAITSFKSTLLGNTRLSTVLFDSPFLKELKGQFDQSFERLESKIVSLEDRVFGAVHQARAEVEEYISHGDFNDRLKVALKAMHEKIALALGELRILRDQQEGELAEAQNSEQLKSEELEQEKKQRSAEREDLSRQLREEQERAAKAKQDFKTQLKQLKQESAETLETLKNDQAQERRYDQESIQSLTR